MSREVDALNDIERATGERQVIHPMTDEENMAILQCFLVPEELESSLRQLAAAKGLIGCRLIRVISCCTVIIKCTLV